MVRDVKNVVDGATVVLRVVGKCFGGDILSYRRLVWVDGLVD